MNIESANLSSLVPSGGTVASMSSPLADGSVVSEGFSGELGAQIELLSNIQPGDSSVLQTPNLAGLQGVSGPQAVDALPVGKAGTQDFAALLGNDLPSSYKTKDDVDHEAALVAVTDTLKYIAIGTTAVEKAVKAEQNMKNVIAMAAPVEESVKGSIATAASVEQGVKDTIATAVSAGQGIKDAIATTVLAGQNIKDAIATAVSAEQSIKDMVTTVVQVEQSVKGMVAASVPAEQSSVQDVVVTVIPVRQNINDGIVTAVPAEQSAKDVFATPVPVEQREQDVVATVVSVKQNIKAAIAVAVPAEHSTEDVMATAVPVEQRMKDVVATAASVDQSVKEAIATVVSAKQNVKDVVVAAVPGRQNGKNAAAVAAHVEQNTVGVVAEAEHGMRNAVVIDAPVQVALDQASDKSEKQQVESDVQVGVEDKNGADGLLAAFILPAVMPTEQGKAASNLAPTDLIKDVGLPSSFIKPSADAKSNQSVEAPDNVLQSEAAFRQPVQGKQDFNLKSFDNAGQIEKAGRLEQQVASLEGEKAVPRGGADIAPLNRAVVDNKTDVPAITKPLTHPEWNKDLGERIVWMSSKAIPSAEIRLNPQHLGPISVRVNVADDQATVVFTAQHAVAREALEASIPKLREMMGTQQLNLVDVSVYQGPASDQGRSQAQNFAQSSTDSRGQGSAGAAIDGIDDVEQEIESGRAVVSKGLLSIYA